MPLLAGTVPVVPGLDALERALTNRDALRIILELSQWELRRLWASMVAQAILEEADREDALDRRDVAWLEGLVSDHNHDEGTIRYCAIDLSWRRLIVERLITQQDYQAARSAVETHLTSPNARLLDLMKHEPPAALEHVHTLGRLYEEHLDRVDKLRAKEKRTGAKYDVPWPPKRLKQHFHVPDEELLTGMTADWARCTLRLLRRMDQICRKCRPHIRDLVYAPTPDRAGPGDAHRRERARSTAAPVATQAGSQDSLPTPDPSSDGVEALMRRSNRVGRGGPSDICRAETSTTARGPQEKRTLPDAVAATDQPLKRQCLPVVPPGASGPTEIGPDSAQIKEASGAPAAMSPKPARTSPPPPPKRPVLRDSSVQTSPPPEEKASRPTKGRDATKSASPVPERDPGRSPDPARPEAPIAEPSDSQAPQGAVLRPSRVAEQDVFSLLMRGAAEQQQRLERDRRKSVTEWLLPVLASDPTPASELARQETKVAKEDDANEPIDDPTARFDAQAAPIDTRIDNTEGDAIMAEADAEKPAAEAPPRQRTLGPTSSAMLMPPPATAGSRPSPSSSARERKRSEDLHQGRCPAERSSEPPNVASDTETSDPVQSGETSSSNTSAASSQQAGGEIVIRDSQEERPPRQKKRKMPVPPTAAQHATISTHPILPLPGFTATTAAATDSDISYEAPAAAQAGDSQDSDRYRASTASAPPFMLPAGSVPSEFDFGPSTSSCTLSTGNVSYCQMPDRAALRAPTSSSEASRAHSQKRPAPIRIGSVPPLEYPRSESGGPQSRASSLPPDMQNGKTDREMSWDDLFSTLPESQIAAAMEEAERQVAARAARKSAALVSTTVDVQKTAGVLAAGTVSQDSADQSVSGSSRRGTDDDNEDGDNLVLKSGGARGMALDSLDANELLPLSQVLAVDGAVSDSHRTDSSDEGGELRRSNSFAGLASEAEQSEAEEGNKEDEEMWAELLKTVIDDVEA